MSNASLTVQETALPPTSPDVLARLTIVQEAMLRAPQASIRTDHILHGGMYTRTLYVDAGLVVIGALVKVPTVLIVCGSAAVFTGDGWIELKGFHLMPGSAGRKQVVVTREPTVFTMIFRTDAKTIEQAEADFTDEADLLVSRRQDDGDTFTITGE